MVRKLIFCFACLAVSIALQAQKKTANSVFNDNFASIDFGKPDLSVPDAMLQEVSFERWLGADGAGLKDDAVLMRISDLLSQQDAIINRLNLIYLTHPDKELRKKAESVLKIMIARQVNQWCNYPMYLQIARISNNLGTVKMRSEKMELLNKYTAFYNRNKFFEKAGNASATNKLITEYVTLQQVYNNTIYTASDSLLINSKITPYLVEKNSFIEKYENKMLPLTEANYLWLMAMCTNQDIRKIIYQQYNNRCDDANGNTMNMLMRLQNKIAVLSGSENYNDYLKMGEVNETANSMLNDDDVKEIKERLVATMATLPALAEAGAKVYPWDIDFLNRMAAVKQGPNELTRMEFATLEDVLNGLIKYTEQKMGVIFIPDKSKGWDASVKAYEVKKDGNMLGIICIDSYQRQGKADVNSSFLLNPNLSNEKSARPMVAMVLNFMPGNDIKLTANQTELVAGVFGDAMHKLFSPTVSYPFSQNQQFSLAGFVYRHLTYDAAVLQNFLMSTDKGNDNEKVFDKWVSLQKNKIIFDINHAIFLSSIQKTISGFSHEMSFDELVTDVKPNAVFSLEEQTSYLNSTPFLFSDSYYELETESNCIAFSVCRHKEIGIDAQTGENIEILEMVLKASTVKRPMEIAEEILRTPKNSNKYLRLVLEQ